MHVIHRQILEYSKTSNNKFLKVYLYYIYYSKTWPESTDIPFCFSEIASKWLQISMKFHFCLLSFWFILRSYIIGNFYTWSWYFFATLSLRFLSLRFLSLRFYISTLKFSFNGQGKIIGTYFSFSLFFSFYYKHNLNVNRNEMN